MNDSYKSPGCKNLPEKQIKQRYESIEVGQCKTTRELYRERIQWWTKLLAISSFPLFFVVVVIAILLGMDKLAERLVGFFILAFPLISEYAKRRKGKHKSDN